MAENKHRKVFFSTNFPTIWYSYCMLGIFSDFFELLRLPVIILGYLSWLFPIILIPVLLKYAIEAWQDYASTKFALSKKKVLLEIRLPSVINKTPLAMEVVISILHIGSRESTWVDRHIKGSSRPSFSLELCSFEGEIHFFIRTEDDFKNLIESQIYAQYPDVQIVEVDDYAKKFEFVKGHNDLFGSEFVKAKDSIVPIKTYVDYGLDREQEEEFKVDPITPMLEFLGTLGPGEQVWYQFIIRMHKTYSFKFKKDDAELSENGEWLKHAEKYLDAKRDALQDKVSGRFRTPSKGEQEHIASVERNISKLPFDIGIRGIYLAEHGKSLRNVARAGFMGVMRQYGSPTFNAIRPNNPTSYDWAWEDFRDIRVTKLKKKMLEYYQNRQYFDLDKKGRIQFVMSTEELATIFHFPGGVATTPSIPRIMSKRSTAPQDLPL